MIVRDFNSFQDFLRTNNVFERFGFKRIGVFGSFSRGENYNDIDLLLEENLNYEQRSTFKKFLEESLNTNIDIVLKDYAEPIILHRALKEIKYATPS
ncbi:MAG: nucleotidyltransferase family protein [Bacteroidia bacterium]